MEKKSKAYFLNGKRMHWCNWIERWLQSIIQKKNMLNFLICALKWNRPHSFLVIHAKTEYLVWKLKCKMRLNDVFFFSIMHWMNWMSGFYLCIWMVTKSSAMNRWIIHSHSIINTNYYVFLFQLHIYFLCVYCVSTVIQRIENSLHAFNINRQ